MSQLRHIAQCSRHVRGWVSELDVVACRDVRISGVEAGEEEALTCCQTCGTAVRTPSNQRLELRAVLQQQRHRIATNAALWQVCHSQHRVESV